MDKYTVSERTLIEAAHLLSPLKTLNSADKVLDFLAKLGIKVPVVDLVTVLSQSFAKIDAVVSATKAVIDADTDEKKLKALLSLLPVINEALNELHKLEVAISAAPGISQAFIQNAHIDQLPRRLLDYLIFDNLQKRYPKLFGALYLMGILDEDLLANDDAVFQSACKLKVVNWDKLPRYLTEPGKVFDEFYQWNTNFNADVFLARLDRFLRAMAVQGGLYKQNDNVKNALGNSTAGLRELRIPIFSKGHYPDSYMQLGLNISPAEAHDAKKKGIAFIPYFSGSSQLDFALGDGWEALLQTNLSIDSGLGLIVRPPFSLEFLQNLFTAPLSAGSLDTGLAVQQKKNASNGEIEVFYLFGDKNSTHLSVSGISTKIFGKSTPSGQDAGAEIAIKAINLLITTGEGDSFLSSLLPSSGIDATFELAVGVSLSKGVYFKGSAGIEVQIPAHIQLGPIDIQGLTIAIKPKDGHIPIEVTSTIKAELGPLKVVVENIGFSQELSFPADRSGNLGPVNTKFGFRPPNGLGISIDTGVVKGGGYLYFNPNKEEYTGALEIEISEFLTIKAIGILTTRMPDGSKGFSLLFILTAEFGSPLQLGFGFTLSGVGGLIGLNRTMLLQPLTEGVRTGAINSVMFPANVVENAPRIISDLNSFFPPQKDIFLIGPMAKIGWGTPNLVTLSLGVIIEIPGNIAIIGVLKVALPDEEDPILCLQVNFIGAIEFDKKQAWFYATTYESRLLTMTIDGQIGVLVSWGDEPNFVVSVGGFHPAFNPPPLPFPEPNRIAISLLNERQARIRVEGYFAVTSNTAQFGARAELYFGLDAFKVDGFIAFDALFQFSPFQFLITISSSMSVKVFGVDLLSVRINGSLSGPTPWRVEGTGSISLLLVDIDVDFSHSWGEAANTDLPPIDVMPLLKAELQKVDNWKAGVPDANRILVSLRKIKTTEGLILHPLGTLQISQRFVPLQLGIDKIGAQKPSDANRFKVTAAKEVSAKPAMEEKGALDEMFAMAQFNNKSDAEKLSAPAYEKAKGGLELSVEGVQTKTASAVKRVVRYEQVIIDTNYKRLVIPFINFIGVLFNFFLQGSAVTESPLSRKRTVHKKPATEKIKLGTTRYAVVYNRDNSPFSDEAASFESHVQALDFMKQQVKKNPNLRDELHVIPQAETRRAV